MLKHKAKVMMFAVVLAGFLIYPIINKGGSPALKDYVPCDEDCQELSIVKNGSNIVLDGVQDSYRPSFTKQLVKDISGSTHNYYVFKDQDASSNTVAISALESSSSSITAASTKSAAIDTNITIETSEDSSSVTRIEGTNQQLKTTLAKFLEMQEFSVEVDSAPKEGLFTRWNPFKKKITSPQAKLILSETLVHQLEDKGNKEYLEYVMAVQDALNEHQVEKNVWIWKEEPIHQAEETVTFLSEQGVQNVYVHFKPNLGEGYPSFIKKATQAGMKVHALIGSPKWGLAAYTADAKKRIDLVQQYNDSVPANEQFVGIHFDVEPYTLDVWDQDREKVVNEWLQSTKEYTSYAKAFGYEVGAALPFWLDNEKVTSIHDHFYKEMMDLHDYVSLMSYRDQALGTNSITSISDQEILYANSPKVELGVELLPYEVENVTFDGKSNKELEQEVALVRKHYLDQKAQGFKGITIHSYTAWRTFLEH
ncbi:poly-gamma-glutamate hydrolase family protein [Pontibacillus salicampi]|uniref:Poly-gamma-glutamate hydrolase family protein n=1 Tax=Pontibacillus salicampi TaxID=1449801 RepID=A0ABV6LLW3_9BACI